MKTKAVRKQLSGLLITNVAALAFALLGTMIGLPRLPEDYTRLILLTALALMGGALVIAYLTVILYEWREVRSEIDVSIAVAQALPNRIQMTRRFDEFRIKPSGDATIRWRFEIEAQSDFTEQHLRFPVYAELPSRNKRPMSAVVIVTACSIDNVPVTIPLQRMFKPIHVRKAVAGDATLPLLYGEISVPVDLNAKHSRCTIDLTMEMVGAFRQPNEDDFAIIEVPYVTKELGVVICADDPAYGIAPGSENEDAIVAYLGSNRDPDEVAAQAKRWHVRKRQFKWTAEYPKLGYAYRVYFQLQESDRGKNDETASREKPQVVRGGNSAAIQATDATDHSAAS